MFNKNKKAKETAVKSEETLNKEVKEQEAAMQELGDDALDAVNGAGDLFADRPRVSTQKIDSSLRNRG